MPVYLQEYDSAVDKKILIFNIDGEWWLTATKLTDGSAEVAWLGKGEAIGLEPGEVSLDMTKVLWTLPYGCDHGSEAIEIFTGHDYLNIHCQKLIIEVADLGKEQAALKESLQAALKESSSSSSSSNPRDTGHGWSNERLKHGWANKMVALIASLQAGNTDRVEQLVELCLGWSLAHVCADVSFTTIKPLGYKQACWLMYASQMAVCCMT
jgi:hypothetical protein